MNRPYLTKGFSITNLIITDIWLLMVIGVNGGVTSVSSGNKGIHVMVIAVNCVVPLLPLVIRVFV